MSPPQGYQEAPPGLTPDHIREIVGEFQALISRRPTPTAVVKGVLMLLYARLRHNHTAAEVGDIFADVGLHTETVMEQQNVLRAEQWRPEWDGEWSSLPEQLRQSVWDQYLAWQDNTEVEDFTIVDGRILGPDGEEL